LSDAFKDNVEQLYAGTRLGRQELDGELLTDTPGALWTVETLEKCRLTHPLHLQGTGTAGGGVGAPPTPANAAEGKFTDIIIGVDPPTGDGTCGIVACAKDSRGIAHVLTDHSVTGLSPEGWARAVANAALIHSSPPRSGGEGDDFREDGNGGGALPSTVHIVAEMNQGGAMVKTVLHTADTRLKVKLVTASVGKSLRAEPPSPCCSKPAGSASTPASPSSKPSRSG
jgi:phage terminase large subunit-like protein